MHMNLMMLSIQTTELKIQMTGILPNLVHPNVTCYSMLRSKPHNYTSKPMVYIDDSFCSNEESQMNKMKLLVLL